MQAQDGSMVGITAGQFNDFIGHGNRNLCRNGDVFKVRRCFFKIVTINENGILADGIKRKEYFDKKKKQMH